VLGASQTDVERIHKLLTGTLGYKEADIRILIDGKATRAAVLDGVIASATGSRGLLAATGIWQARSPLNRAELRTRQSPDHDRNMVQAFELRASPPSLDGRTINLTGRDRLTVRSNGHDGLARVAQEMSQKKRPASPSSHRQGRRHGVALPSIRMRISAPVAQRAGQELVYPFDIGLRCAEHSGSELLVLVVVDATSKARRQAQRGGADQARAAAAIKRIGLLSALVKMLPMPIVHRLPGKGVLERLRQDDGGIGAGQGS